MAETVQDSDERLRHLRQVVRARTRSPYGMRSARSARSRIPSAGAARSCRRGTKTSSTSRATSSTSPRATCSSHFELMPPPDVNKSEVAGRRGASRSTTAARRRSRPTRRYTRGRASCCCRRSRRRQSRVGSRRRASSARRLIDGFIANGRADGAADYAQQIPPRVIAAMLGIPKEMAATFTEWVRGFLELGLTNPELRESRRATSSPTCTSASKSASRTPGRTT